MGRLRSGGLSLVVAIISFWTLAGCGGTKAGTPLYPGHITISPAVNTSLVLGGTIGFVASAQTASGTSLRIPIAYSSSDTSILNLSPNGVACAGHWDAAFTTCTPGNVGIALVTASALNATSEPTYVFVHPPIDNITVTGILLNGIPIQEPCLSQTQTMTVEAHAFSQGADITSSVGPFIWTANNPSVVTLTPLSNTTFNPITNQTYNFPTNQATALAVAPGMTYIYATASGVTSNTFQQPQYNNSQQQTSPVLDFFATCPIQNIALEVGSAGSGQTSFVASKGTNQTVVATLTDVMGNSSLPNTTGRLVLSKIPLTWSGSHLGAIATANGCTNSCSVSTQAAGSGSITASCTPPSCNVGFPLLPASLSTNGQIDPVKINACTAFFQSVTPKNFSCQLVIPMPVYASPVSTIPPSEVIPLVPPTGAISGLATGAPAAVSVLAASTGCAQVPPETCSTSAYYLSTAKAAAGNENPLPTAPNSFLYDSAGDRAFMGSQFGALSVNPANFGTSTSPFLGLGSVTGTALAASTTGTIGLFADNVHTPNQVYVVNVTNLAAGTIALNISGATAGAFSPDGLKTFILGNNGNSLYIYSPLQALQGPIALSGPAHEVGFAPSGAFAFIAQSAAGSNPARLTAFATCNNQVAGNLTLPANPILMKVLPNSHIDGKDSYGNAIPDGAHLLLLDSTGFDVVTSTIGTPATGTLCPQSLQFISDDPLRPAQRIELGQGTLQPLNFFYSPDGTQLYIVPSDSSTILIYNFIVGAVVGGIELQGNAVPLSADISADGGTIVVAASDGMLHELTTAAGGADLIQLPFPTLPNYTNAFCSVTPSAGPCSLSIALARP